MGKLFAVLEGVQEGIMLSDRVWIDETYWPLTAKDAVRKLLWGLSANQMCIGAGVDDSGTFIYLHEGFGKTSKAKTRATFGVRIERGSTLLHDMEDLGLSSESYSAQAFEEGPDDLNPLCPLNRACFLLKSFLGSHPGFDRGDLQG
ncbi:hypothetical protein [Atopobium sp. oral taxon 416]|uniref:hypothetical protein n=1 Tax=Atopobium sp. oral taxon 416 TaxID=712157 RepID=UPI001BA452BA|nr:hypothetical protein [Atopobium sp. oral taxon 416]QUC03347.1 hypothetical protein J4859_15500 [Atopobium sp. oral taxon 416]